MESAPEKFASVLRRLMAKVEIDPVSGCWLFVGYCCKEGYGRLWPGKALEEIETSKLAHRVSYAAHRGRIPGRLELDHKCFVRACVNPDHLEPVTHTVNMQPERRPPHVLTGRKYVLRLPERSDQGCPGRRKTAASASSRR